MNAELMRQHQAKKERAARFARSAFKVQPIIPLGEDKPVSRPSMVEGPQADAHCHVWRQKKLCDAAAPSLAILKQRSSIKKIQRTVARRFGLTMEDMKSPRRHKGLVEPRQIAMYIAHDVYKRSFPEIGYHFGGRDHTTALHAHRKIKRLLKIDTALNELVSDLCQQVSA